MSRAPRSSRPSAMMPAPMPVPMVRNTIFSQPRPAPYFHSTSAQALASFCKKAGMSNASSSIFTMGTSSHPGRFGGDCTTPVREFRGPPQLTPMACTGASDSRISSAAAASSLCRAYSKPSSVWVSKRILRMISIFSPASASSTAHFVPPTSNPSTRIRSTPPILSRNRGFSQDTTAPPGCQPTVFSDKFCEN